MLALESFLERLAETRRVAVMPNSYNFLLLSRDAIQWTPVGGEDC